LIVIRIRTFPEKLSAAAHGETAREPDDRRVFAGNWFVFLVEWRLANIGGHRTQLRGIVDQFVRTPFGRRIHLLAVPQRLHEFRLMPLAFLQQGGGGFKRLRRGSGQKTKADGDGN